MHKEPTNVRNVLFVIPTLSTGGSERVIYNLVRHMPKEVYNFSVLALHDGPLRDSFMREGCIVEVMERRPGLDWNISVAILRMIKHHHIQVINTHHFVSLFYTFPVAKLARIPIVHVEHSIWEIEQLKWNLRAISSVMLNHVEGVVAVSEELYAFLQTKIRRPLRLKNIINGIPLEDYDRKQDVGVKRSELGLKTSDTVIGCVGNLRPEKNHPMLLRAFALAIIQCPELRLLMVGDGPCRRELENMVDVLGISAQVIFAGVRLDVAALYAIMDMYCLTSQYEGLPLTVLEAMASRVPVIGTDVLGIREIIRHGQTGLLVGLNDERQLKETILQVCGHRDSFEGMTAHAYALVNQKYNIQNNAWEYHKIFQAMK